MPKVKAKSSSSAANILPPQSKSIFLRMKHLFDEDSDSDFDSESNNQSSSYNEQVPEISHHINTCDTLESNSDPAVISQEKHTDTDSASMEMREWNQKGIPKTLPYNRSVYTKFNRIQKQEQDGWVSITKLNDVVSITPPHEASTKGDADLNGITYTNTIDCANQWTDKIMDAFEKVSSQNSGLSEDFKQSLGKLSFFRKPLVSK